MIGVLICIAIGGVNIALMIGLYLAYRWTNNKVEGLVEKLFQFPQPPVRTIEVVGPIEIWEKGTRV